MPAKTLVVTLLALFASTLAAPIDTRGLPSIVDVAIDPDIVTGRSVPDVTLESVAPESVDRRAAPVVAERINNPNHVTGRTIPDLTDLLKGLNPPERIF
ncbi:hypothetical protein BU24DRAFT_463170 [Aaosphaeria arxii CBS 175.79]|uniref:Uncharacterized protein n=1 Tax=Aaosphaeria arxii CBS 175.79 TaxID=1450172 RepID=A0A6A5XMA7_9PLEO|nr:uncharacterized protein BU24DRAFT_463170 [Aaosphaeria arxii CBS 175.79]KAF2014375.1 hypothetical protein BU24DRAFT_463170 [Aaosphaeria arxii CBS 175.79]